MLQSVKRYGEVKSNYTDTDQDYQFPGRGGGKHSEHVTSDQRPE